MTHPACRLSILSTPIAFVLVWLGPIVANSALAAEPEIAFGLKDGFIQCKLTQNGAPLGEVKLRIMDAAFRTRCEGETGASGVGLFPVPKESMFVVSVETGGRVSDPIWIRNGPDGLTPDEVQLTFGLLPCCQMYMTDPKNSYSHSQFAHSSGNDSRLVGVILLLSLIVAGAIYLGRTANKPLRGKKGMRR